MKRALYGSVAAIAVFSASSAWSQDIFDPGEIVLSRNFSPVEQGRNGATVEVVDGAEIAGVVDITTFTPKTLSFSGRGQLEVGSVETYSGTLSLGVATDRGEVAATFGYVKREDISARTSDNEKDGFGLRSLAFTASLDLNDVLTISGALLYRDSTIEIDRSTPTHLVKTKWKSWAHAFWKTSRRVV